MAFPFKSSSDRNRIIRIDNIVFEALNRSIFIFAAMKLSGLILAIFYFFSSVGYGLEVHYCLGEVSDVSYALLDTHCACDLLDEPHERKCCEEKSFFNQLESEHSAPSLTDVSMVLLPVAAELDWNAMQSSDASSLKSYNFIDRGPPKSRDRIIEFHSLIIYG